MLLKYNISNDKVSRKLINVDSYEIKNFDTNNVYCTIICTTKAPHNLKIGDSVIFKRGVDFADTYGIHYNKTEFPQTGNYIVRLLNDSMYHKKGYYKYYNWYNESDEIKHKLTPITEEEATNELNPFNSLIKPCVIESDNFSDTTFSFYYPIRETLSINSVSQYDKMEWISLKNNLPILVTKKDGAIKPIERGDEIELRLVTYSYKYIREETDEDFNVTIVKDNPENSTEYISNQVNYFNNIYEWKPSRTTIKCEYITPNSIMHNHTDEDDNVLTNNSVLEFDSLFLFETGTSTICRDVKLYENNLNFNLSLPLINQNSINFSDENNIRLYFEEKKDELLTDIVDYEKKCFSPWYKKLVSDETFKGTTTLAYKPVNSIKFNLFFRDRTDNPEWNTDDTKGWFQCPIRDGVVNLPDEITDGDKLEYLGFTDDDIYYRKQKVSKSFLRLSFYSTNDPMNNMLLFYSTIFLDSADLYDKFIKNKFNTSKKETPIDLTASFTIYDKYNRSKSSEGFYLYLFPDNIDVSTGRTIYMKAEFNHAGYGKTIPFIHPRGFTFVNDKKGLNRRNFPFYLMDESGSLSNYYNNLYIPITLRYIENTGEYIYYFNNVQQDNSNIVINLFEPKLNRLE